MNQKTAKYLRRKARNEIRARMAEFEEHLRPKPWWVPARVWGWGMRIFIKAEL